MPFSLAQAHGRSAFQARARARVLGGGGATTWLFVLLQCALQRSAVAGGYVQRSVRWAMRSKRTKQVCMARAYVQDIEYKVFVPVPFHVSPFSPKRFDACSADDTRLPLLPLRTTGHGADQWAAAAAALPWCALPAGRTTPSAPRRDQHPSAALSSQRHGAVLHPVPPPTPLVQTDLRTDRLRRASHVHNRTGQQGRLTQSNVSCLGFVFCALRPSDGAISLTDWGASTSPALCIQGKE